MTSELSFLVLYIKTSTRNFSDYGPYQPLSYHHSTNYERYRKHILNWKTKYFEGNSELSFFDLY